MTLSPRFEDALVFAARLHACAVRKGTTIPYVSHVLGVASLAVEPGADEDDAIAALMHDTVEDARGDPEVIRLKELGDIRLFALPERRLRLAARVGAAVHDLERGPPVPSTDLEASASTYR